MSTILKGHAIVIATSNEPVDALDQAVRMRVFEQAAMTGEIPKLADVAASLGISSEAVAAALKRLATGKVIILASNDGEIWAANPFCAVPSGFRVETGGVSYWGICIWDALGIVAALQASEAIIRAPCGDCSEPLELEFEGGRLVRSEGVIHFAVPARQWWQNIGFA